jgi:hypothetical protein
MLDIPAYCLERRVDTGEPISLKMGFFIRQGLTIEQKQCPHCIVTGPSKKSPQIGHRIKPSRDLRPGARELSGKSSGMVIESA